MAKLKASDIWGEDWETIRNSGLSKDTLVRITKERAQKLREDVLKTRQSDTLTTKLPYRPPSGEAITLKEPSKEEISDYQKRVEEAKAANRFASVDENGNIIPGKYTPENINSEKQQAIEKETAKKIKLFKEDLKNDNFLTRGLKSVADEYLLLGDSALNKIGIIGDDTLNTSRALVKANEEYSDEVNDAKRSPIRQEEVRRLEEQIGTAKGIGDKATATARLMLDKITHPGEIDPAEAVAMGLDPLNLVAPEAAAIAKSAKLGRAAKAGIGAAAGGAAQGGIAGGQSYLLSKAKGESDEQAKEAGLIGGALGAGMGAGLGGITGAFAKSVKPVIKEKIKAKTTDDVVSEAMKNPTTEDTAKTGDNGGGQPQSEASADESGLKFDKEVIDEFLDDELKQLDEVESHAEAAKPVIEQISTQAQTPEQINTMVAQYAPPTTKEQAFSLVLNDNKPVSPRFAGMRFRDALKKSIEAPRRTPEELYGVLVSEGVTPEHAAAATEAYKAGDLSLYDAYMTNKLSDAIHKSVTGKRKKLESRDDERIRDRGEDQQGDAAGSTRGDDTGVDAAGAENGANTKQTAVQGDKPGSGETVREDGSNPGENREADGVPQKDETMDGHQTTGYDRKDISGRGSDELVPEKDAGDPGTAVEKELFEALKQHPKFAQHLKERENVTAKDIRYAKKQTTKGTFSPEGDYIAPGYEKNWLSDFEITKEDVRKIKAGTADEQTLQKLKNDLERYDNDPVYYDHEEKLAKEYDALPEDDKDIDFVTGEWFTKDDPHIGELLKRADEEIKREKRSTDNVVKRGKEPDVNKDDGAVQKGRAAYTKDGGRTEEPAASRAGESVAQAEESPADKITGALSEVERVEYARLKNRIDSLEGEEIARFTELDQKVHPEEYAFAQKVWGEYEGAKRRVSRHMRSGKVLNPFHKDVQILGRTAVLRGANTLAKFARAMRSMLKKGYRYIKPKIKQLFEKVYNQVEKWAQKNGHSGQIVRAIIGRSYAVADGEMPHVPKSSLAEFVKKAISHKENTTLKKTVAKASDKLVKFAKKHGLNIDGYKHVIDNYSIKHILKQHGDPKKEAAKGQLPITEADIAKYRDIVENFDAVKTGGKTKQGRDTFVYAKLYKDELYVVQEVRTGKNELALTTMYKKKVTTPDAPDKKSVPRSNARNVSSQKHSISEKSVDVKTGEGKTLAPETKIQRLRRTLQDRFIRVKELQKVKTGRDELADNVDIYRAEERYSGRASAKIKLLKEKIVDPMLKYIAKSPYELEDVDLYLHARHAKERNAKMLEISGKENGSGMSDAEAEKILEKYDTREMREIAKYVDAMTDARLKIIEYEGLESKEYVDMLRKSYKHYVPLQRVMDDGSTHAGGNLGSGFDVKGKEFKFARGSDRAVESPLIHTIKGFEETVIRAEKNRVGKTFLRFAEKYPDEKLYEVESLRYKPRYDKNGEVIMMDPQYQLKDNVMHVKVDGKIKQVTFHDPALASAFKNLNSTNVNLYVQILAKPLRFLAAVNTQYNPEFVISNLMRDLQTARMNLPGEVKAVGKIQFGKDVKDAIHGVYRKERGKPNNGNEWSTLFAEMEKEGGTTGWLDQYAPEEGLRSLADELAMLRGEKRIKKTIKSIGKYIDDVNTAVESGVRLVAYKYAKDSGLSKAQAASIAKNLTVNFNRKGDAGAVINSFYMFYNASIQGSARLMHALKTSKRAQMGAASLTGLTAALHMYNMYVNEEKYRQIPQFVKDTHLIIIIPDSVPVMGGKFIKIPIGYGYNVFTSLGYAIGEMYTDGKISSPIGRVISSMANAFSPVGVGDNVAHTIVPTLMKLPVEIATNKNFFGGDIMPTYGDDKSESHRYFKSVNPLMKDIAIELNDLTGGTTYTSGWFDVSPELMEHTVGFVTGGLGKLAMNTYTTVANAFDDDKHVSVRKVPFLRKLVSELTDKSEYYVARDIMDESKTKVLDKKEVKRFEYLLKSAYEQEQIDEKTYVRKLRKFANTQLKNNWSKELNVQGDGTKKQKLELLRRQLELRMDPKYKYRKGDVTKKRNEIRKLKMKSEF